MKRTSILFTLLLVIGLAQGQITIVDSLSQEAIPAVSVFNKDGILLGISDSDGKILFDQNTAAGLNLSFQHISYKNKAYQTKNTESSFTVQLSPNSTIIQEIVINNQAKDYVVLKGYYRTLETFDNNHKYFSDGIVEYYIPLAHKDRVRFRIIENRVFGNKQTIAEFKNVMGPFTEPPTVTYIEAQPLNKKLSKDYLIADGSDSRNILKKEQIIGRISPLNNNTITQIYVDFVKPDSIKKRKIFRLESHFKQLVEIESHTTRATLPQDKRELQSYYSNGVGSIKRKKKHGYIPYERTNEFYVMERSFISKEEYAGVKEQLTGKMFLEEESSFKTSYWENLDDYGIPAIDPSVKTVLGKTMQLFDAKK